MKQIAFLLLAMLPCTAIAQEQARTNDGGKCYLTIITHADWAQRPSEKSLIDAVQASPMLGIAQKCHFSHVTTGMAMYGTRWQKYYPEHTLPAIVLQRPDGAYWYKASGSNVPQGSAALFSDMERHCKLLPYEYQPPVEQSSEGRVFPLRRPADDDSGMPDTATLFGGQAPIRDSLASAATIMNGIVAVVFLLVASTVAAIVLKILQKL